MYTQKKHPAWLDNAIFYEIYPQSFRDSNADGIGDIPGIIEKLDYIKDLGFSAIWLNPCFQSPFRDAGYDVEDYYTVANRYGTNEDLIHLFQEAHARNMHVLLDLVPGHTAITHKWFQESMKATRNPYTDRYVWTDSVWTEPDGMSSLKGISDRDGACAVNFFSHQPALNYGYYHRDPQQKWQQAMDAEGPMATRAALKDIMRFWLKAGCDGFRVDMAGSLVKNDFEGKGTISLWQDIRSFLDSEFAEAVLISEWGEPDKSLIGGFHMDFLLHFGPSHYNDLFRCKHPYFKKDGAGSAKEFVAAYQKNLAQTKENGLICIPSGNHDMERLAKYLDPDELKVAFAFLLSMPGAPFVYYGDEIGMRYVEGLTSVEGGFQRTGSRTPMQWNSGLNAGFSSASSEKLYTSQDTAMDRINVEVEEADMNSLLNEIKHLIAFRQENEALKNNGKIQFISDNYPLVYKRFTEKQEILVVLQPASKTIQLTKITGTILYHVGAKPSLYNHTLTLPGCSAVFIELKHC